MQNIIRKDGFAFSFDPSACAKCDGVCCRGESGYVWVDRRDIENISNFLNIDIDDFIKDFLKKVGYKWSIKEIKRDGEYQCIFFDKGCTIYPVRPRQCRDFPFWERYKNPKYIEEVCKECIGILLDR